jgi:hypothetical protein
MGGLIYSGVRGKASGDVGSELAAQRRKVAAWGK